MSSDERLLPAPFAAVEFAENPEQRTPCVMVLDTSGSMHGQRIAQVNEGIAQYRSSLVSDPIASKRVDVALVTFGGTVQTRSDFTTVEGFASHSLQADGETPMGAAVSRALDMLAARKQAYKEHGIPYLRPWLFLITDGEPSDAWEAVAERARREVEEKKLTFFAVGVEGANMSVLARFSRQVYQLQGLQFRELFVWLSKSQQTLSRSQSGAQVNLPQTSCIISVEV